MQQEREEVYEALQYAASFYLGPPLGQCKQCQSNPEFSLKRRTLREQRRLSILSWNPGPWRGKEGAIEKHIAVKWHNIALQEAIEYKAAAG